MDFRLINETDLKEREYTSPKLPSIKVIGVGGAGNNAVKRMIDDKVNGVVLAAANTDLQALNRSCAEINIHLGSAQAQGFGAGGDPQKGRVAAEESKGQIEEFLNGTDMLFITTGLGGGTGTGATPVIAGIARNMGILTVGVVSTPFQFEGPGRMSIARDGIEMLSEKVDSLIVLSNEKLLATIDKRTSIEGAFKEMDSVLMMGIQGISDLITVPGQINVDLADVDAVMRNGGSAVLGIGVGRGDNRAIDAISAAVNNKLLEQEEFENATSLLLNITGNDDLGMIECQEIMNKVASYVAPDAKMKMGTSLDSSFDDELRVTLVATGISSSSETAIKEDTSESIISLKNWESLTSHSPDEEKIAVNHYPPSMRAKDLYTPALIRKRSEEKYSE